MVHIHMKIKGVQSTQTKAPDTDLSENKNTNLVFFVTLDPRDSNKDKIYSDLCGLLTTMPNKGNIYIYVIYVYYYWNTKPPHTMKNRTEKEMIQAFTGLDTELKDQGFKPS